MYVQTHTHAYHRVSSAYLPINIGKILLNTKKIEETVRNTNCFLNIIMFKLSSFQQIITKKFKESYSTETYI